MRDHLGWLAFILATAFAICLMGTLILNSWFGFSGQKCAIGFFGFGIPTMIVGRATASLWEDKKDLQQLLGWAATMVALVCGVSVLVLVGGWVLSDRAGVAAGPLLARLIGFGVTGLVCGRFGIARLFKAEK